MHEFNIGTSDMLKAQQKKMMMMAENGAIEGDRIKSLSDENENAGYGSMMEHNDPNSALLEPEKSQETI